MKDAIIMMIIDYFRKKVHFASKHYATLSDLNVVVKAVVVGGVDLVGEEPGGAGPGDAVVLLVGLLPLHGLHQNLEL